MQPFYAEQFEREMGCTEAEWLGWLPAAIGANVCRYDAQSAQVQLSKAAMLSIAWHVATPRAIALARIPRLIVSFRFTGADAAERLVFMKRFDLYMQRGGG